MRTAVVFFVLLFGLAAFFYAREKTSMVDEFRPTLLDLSTHHGGMRVRAARRDRVLLISFVNADLANKDSLSKRAWLRDAAIRARETYIFPDSIDSVRTSFTSLVQEQGRTVTREWPRYTWALAELGDTGTVNPQDDAFARSFLENLRTGSRAGIAQLHPIQRAHAWDSIALFRSVLPQDEPDTVQLRHWEHLDTLGGIWKLTYVVIGRSEAGRAEIHVQNQAGARVVRAFFVEAERVENALRSTRQILR